MEGPDGQNYRWSCGLLTSKLVRLDGVDGKTVIAQMYRHRVPVFASFKPLRLDIIDGITPDVLDMLIISFAYVERRRRLRERALHYWSVNFFR
jgi:hypothetical protein